MAAGGAGAKPAAAVKHQRQLTTFLPQAAAGPGQLQAAQQEQQQQEQWGPRQRGTADNPLRDAAPRPQERSLLATLYPSATAGSGSSSGGGQPSPAPQRTPQLAGRRMAARATPAASTLWSSAGACVAVAPTLGARLAAREAADPEGAAARKQPLARGGTCYPAGDETRALKRVRLEALRQELRMHEETAAQLRGMIAGLEREVGEG